MRNFFLIGLLGVLTTTADFAEPAGLTLFEHRGTDVKIVLPQAATEAEKDAAGELKQFLDRASGATFPIVGEGEADRGLFVGRTKLAEEWGLPPPPPAPDQDEGFAIEVRGDTGGAVLVGTIDMATKFAVYHFLARFVGVRWFLPGELFQVVPQPDRLVVPDCSLREIPALSGRVLAYSLAGELYPDLLDPQFGSPFVDYHADPHAVRIDTSRRGRPAARWACRNLLSVDGRLEASFHGHNFIRIFNYASYFPEHPEYYPKRYGAQGVVPSTSYGWQPCLAEPGVLQVTLDWGRDFFRRNPEHWAWFSLGINDGGGWCGCEDCQALTPHRGNYRGHPIMTDHYLHFVRKVAEVMLQEFPDRKVSVLAYHSTVVPPVSEEKLPPNVNVVVTRDSFQYHDPAYLEADLEHDKRWLALTHGNLYRYDYYSGSFLVPRYYPHRLAEDIRRMRDLGIKGIYAEDLPAWPTVGPSYYVAAKLWWDPDRDVDELLKEFHTTLFGPAAEPMARFWNRHEEVWLQERPGKWFEGFGDINTQASMFRPSDLAYLDQQLQEAYQRAGTDELIRRRIRFFEQGWRLAEHYIREYHLLQALQAAPSPEATERLARQLLAAVQARHAFWAEFRQEPRFPGQSGPCEDYRFLFETLKHYAEWEGNHQATLALVAARLASQSPDTYQRLLADYTKAHADDKFIESLQIARVVALAQQTPNLIRNPGFELGDGNDQPAEKDWITQGAPQHWAQWKLTTGSFSFDSGIARIHGTDNGVWLQTFPLHPGEEIFGSVQYRLAVDAPAKAKLTVAWQDQTGQWLGNYTTVGFNATSLGRADDWQEVFCHHIVPAGAATAVFMFGAEKLPPQAVVEFRNPYFGKIAEK